ncbi:MAG: peptide ABC transporter substrate-binding protein [Clostridium sp.]|nr:peptide ABC transporter substrate-binding protein [Clostridium sp.]
MNNKLLYIFINFIIICVLCTGCFEKKDDIEVISKDNHYIVFDIGKLPQDLIKLDGSSSNASELASSVFEGLLRQDDNKPSGYEYALAKDCSISKDGLVYTFTLKDSIKWSNGKDITAQNFCDFFKMILNSKYNSIYKDQLSIIYGVSDFVNGKSEFSSVAINAISKNSLQIRLNYKAPYFLKLLSQPIYGLRTSSKELSNWKTNFNEINYSGPFEIEKVNKSGSIVLHKNQYYVFKNRVKSNKITLAQDKNGSDFSMADFETYNNIDIFLNPPATEIKDLKEKNEESDFNSFSVKTLFFNLKSSNFANNSNFRKAINFAIDRTSLQNKIKYDNESVNYSFFPNSMNTSLGLVNLPCSSKYAASECLKNSLYNDETIKIVYLDEGFNRSGCMALIDNINSNLNLVGAPKIKFEAVGYSKSDIKDVIESGDYDIYLGDYSLKYDDVMSFFEKWQSGYYENIYGYKSSVYDNLLYDAKVTYDAKEKNTFYIECIQELQDDMPFIPLYTKRINACYKTFVKGISFNKFGNIEIDSLYAGN